MLLYCFATNCDFLGLQKNPWGGNEGGTKSLVVFRFKQLSESLYMIMWWSPLRNVSTVSQKLHFHIKLLLNTLVPMSLSSCWYAEDHSKFRTLCRCNQEQKCTEAAEKSMMILISTFSKAQCWDLKPYPPHGFFQKSF